MDCSASIIIHLLRGIGAFVLVGVAFCVAPIYPLIVLPALISAMFLLGGCPMCWLMGLAEKLKRRRYKKLSNESK